MKSKVSLMFSHLHNNVRHNSIWHVGVRFYTMIGWISAIIRMAETFQWNQKSCDIQNKLNTHNCGRTVAQVKVSVITVLNKLWLPYTYLVWTYHFLINCCLIRYTDTGGELYVWKMPTDQQWFLIHEPVRKYR